MLITTFHVAIMIERQVYYANNDFFVADIKNRQSIYAKGSRMGLSYL